MAINTIAVIGSGTMGNGIAHVAAQTGLDVILIDVQQAAIDKALATIEKNMDRQVKKGSMTDDEKKTSLARITTSTTVGAAFKSDLVIEAASERIEVKNAIFAELDAGCAPGTILASNTSSISITELAGATKRADRFIGMHFF